MLRRSAAILNGHRRKSRESCLSYFTYSQTFLLTLLPAHYSPRLPASTRRSTPRLVLATLLPSAKG